MSETGTLDLTVLSAEKLKSQRFLGRRRIFVICQVGVQKERTRPCSETCPKWSETFRFLITSERTAFITIKRKNFLFPSTVIGNVEVDLDKVLVQGKDLQSVPVVTAMSDRCFSQIMSEKGTLHLSLTFLNWRKDAK